MIDLASVTEFVAQRVRQLRAERRWSAQQLADACAAAGFDSLSRGTIAKIESSSRKSITVEEVHTLAKAFGVPPSDLLPPPSPEGVRLSDELGGETLLDWLKDQTQRMRLADPPLSRTQVPEEGHLHLTIMVERDAIDPARCVLSYWRQDDLHSWPPARGAVHEVPFDELEYRVDEVILDAEKVWADQAAPAAVEFLLPRTLLNLPVQRWQKEHESGRPRPLSLDYRVSVRSLERMRTRHWHRLWNVRWDSMLDHPSADRLYHSGSEEFQDYSIDAVLSDPRWVGLVLAKPPSHHPEPGTEPDELVSALRCGLPVIIWHPHAAPEELREALDWLLSGDNGLLDFPDRRRIASSPSAPFHHFLLRDLVVLWDDPKRVLVLD